MTTLNTDLIARHFLIAALWSEADHDGEPLENRFDILDVHPDTVAEVKRQCHAFVQAAPELVFAAAKFYLQEAAHHPDTRSAEACIGHDLLLTRNGHGAGFWCRGMGQLGRDLADLCGYSTAFPQMDFYVGDDGLVHGGW